MRGRMLAVSFSTAKIEGKEMGHNEASGLRYEHCSR